MISTTFTVESNRPLSPGVFEMTLSGDASSISRPGQFVELSIPGHFLRRPISVCDWTNHSLKLLIRVAGDGTAWLRNAATGTAIDILLPLGNGFDITAIPAGAFTILAGGGIGIAPLFALAKSILASGRDCRAALGFRSRSDVFFADRFAAIGCDVAIATEDGSLGTKGFVTNLLTPPTQCAPSAVGIETSASPLPYMFACGPMPMLRALAALQGFSGAQFSLEAHMGCGFGACMGCTIETACGPARICHEGPVFTKEVLAW